MSTGDAAGVMVEAAFLATLFTTGNNEHTPVDYNDPLTRSNRCKTECIDNDLNYCINENLDGGTCCELNEDCPRSSICSNDQPKAPNMFKYMACPNEQACGTKYIYP